MDRSFEKSLSKIITFLVLVVFLITIVSGQVNIWFVSYIWAVGFLLVWALMLLYSSYILFQKNSYGLSIFFAILTALAFLVLAVPAIITLARFIPFISQNVILENEFLLLNGPIIFYTTLIVMYFVHLFNIISLNKKDGRNLENNEKNDKIDDEDEIFNNYDSRVIKDNEDVDKNRDEIKIFESKNNEDIDYNTQKVILVEDLTDEEIEEINNMKDEENNG